MNRRRFFLKNVLASSLILPGLARAGRTSPAPAAERSLRFYNTHTGETLRSVFWAEGQFLPEALSDINKLLRDHRSNTIAAIDPQLLILLDKVSSQFGNDNIIHVISGYRSAQTNRKLAARSKGVAKHSLHLEGRAIDVRIPGRDLSSLHRAALDLKGGGVGYYPDSQFIHMDTGRVRNW
ncbi:MAG: hypothetical protein ACI83P_002382 [Janthinobacterium sp.]|jgi:uncharacterized protein YcbK (DUF882 family)